MQTSSPVKFRVTRWQCGRRLWLSLIVGLLLPATVQAQNLFSNLVFAVGTTTRDSGGRDWSLVVLGSPQPGLLAGKRFAVFGKPGHPAEAGAFTRRGLIFERTNPTEINNLLTQSVALGQDLTSLNQTLEVLLHRVSDITNQTLAQKVGTAFNVSRADSSIAQMATLLARANPGLLLCSGQGFAELVTGVTTYELRELQPATGNPGDVVGRVTITPGSPVVLPAPGPPFQVVTNSPADHLRIRLRWGSPDELRRLSLLSFGYNVWRIPAALAEAAGYDANAPSVSQLHTDPNFKLVNHSPVTASRDFTAGSGAGAADDPADRVTYFFSDDNGVNTGGAPFGDGDQFYYFVTARDLLGRDGLASTGGQTRACRRRPPLAPTALKVQNSIQAQPLAGGLVTNQARFLVSWPQNVDSTNLISEYWIYRWQNPADALNHDVQPLAGRVGVVPHLAGTNTGSFLDNAADAPVLPGVSNLWYTVRAVSQAKCDPLLSPHSGPASGVLRERSAPAGTTGAVFGSCGTPAVILQSFGTLTNTPDVSSWYYRLTCQRRDFGIAWVQYSVTNTSGQVATYGPIYFAPGSASAQVDFQVPNRGDASELDIGCVVGTFSGLTSASAYARIVDPVPSGQRFEAVFFSGQLLETAISLNDPLLYALAGGSLTYYSAINPTPDPSGTVGMKFPVPPQAPVLVQVMTSNSTWTAVGVVWPDANQKYWISYPACILGPLPPIRGSLLNLPNLPDCEQHVARAAPDGAVAPIQVRFALTARTREYRLYRTVNDGPLTLMARSPAPFDSANPSKQIVRTDDAMPAGAAHLCYYVQLLDEHGNGSPMSFLGCKPVAPSPPPRPTLAQPIAAGDLSNPQVTLNWFCPTSGVARFQVMIGRNDGQTNGFVASRLRNVLSFNRLAVYLGLKSGQAPSKGTHYVTAQLTPPIGTDFGPGPQFSLTVGVSPNVAYSISVASVDAQGKVWDASPEWTFTWKPPMELPTVPWPARPLPTITSFDDSAVDHVAFRRVAAVLQTYYDPNLQTYVVDRRYPVGIRFGRFDNTLEVISTVGRTNLVSYNVDTQSYGAALADPNNFVFRRQSSDSTLQGQPLLPIVLYRQQVTNAAFPRVSARMTQVSPLLERLPWQQQGVLGINRTVITIADRLIGTGNETIADLPYSFLYLRDQQPVVAGARYRYYVLRMNEKREIAETIPAGEVEIPYP